MRNLSELIDREKLQLIQEELCCATGICAYCLDAEGRKLTELSGTPERKARAQEYAGHSGVAMALERVEEGSLEDLALEDLEGGDQVAAAAIRDKGDTVIYWVVFFLPQDGDSDRGRFMKTVDFLRDFSSILIRNKIISFSAEVESRRSRDAQQEMSRSLHTTEAMASVVNLLDSDEPAVKLMEEWLRLVSVYLDVDTSQLYQNDKQTDTMDLRCEWLAPGQASIYDRTHRLTIPRMLRTEKPMIISSDVPDEDLKVYLKEWKLQALIQLPVIQRGDQGALMLSLNHRKRHVWTMEEIKFSCDAVRVLNSILARRLQKSTITESYKAMETVLDNVGCSVYVTERGTGEMLFANRWMQSTFGKELKDGTFSEMLRQALAGGQESGVCQLEHVRRGRWYDLMQRQVSWIDGRQAVIYSLYDITDKKLYQRKIEMQANTDFLTGLYNRMCCERDLARQLDEAQKGAGKGALFYLDLDDFKHINDGLGHQYGDVLLKSISHALQRIPGIQESCYRVGGDEFVIIVPARYYGEYDRIVEDIRGVFSRPWPLKDGDYYCTMSMGCVTFPDMGSTVAELVKKADIALYEAKRSGKNRILQYQNGDITGSGRRLDMEKNMRDAAENGCREFEVYYQPIINVQEGETCAGAEALIRWNSSKLGFIPPAEFVPLAEYLGLINPIGGYVLKEACEQCHRWNQAGYPDYKVNVNLSVVQLLQADVVESVERALEESGLAPRNLVLEVTESLAINDMERMKGILNRIRSLGVKIALDDFGTGYSSLNHIREIPFDLIKVDQSFSKDLATDAFSRSFIKMVAELAGTLGVRVCVEGIETKEQLKMLGGMNVEYIQGFYFDRPMKRQDFERKYAPDVP